MKYAEQLKVTDVLKDRRYLFSNHVDGAEDRNTENKKLNIRVTA